VSGKEDEEGYIRMGDFLIVKDFFFLGIIEINEYH